MKYFVRTWMKYLLRGVLWGCTFFVFFCLFAFFVQGKDFLLSILDAYPKHALGSILVGIGYGTSPIVYGWERPSLFVKTGLHFLVGTGIFFCVAFWCSWIPMQSDRYLVLELLVSCVTFAVMWSVFYLFSRKEAEIINERLRKLTKDEMDRIAQ